MMAVIFVADLTTCVIVECLSLECPNQQHEISRLACRTSFAASLNSHTMKTMNIPSLICLKAGPTEVRYRCRKEVGIKAVQNSTMAGDEGSSVLIASPDSKSLVHSTPVGNTRCITTRKDNMIRIDKN